MSFLTIGKNTSKKRLVEIYKKYKSEYENATDVFEKAEISGYLDTIYDFCIFRGGYDYWQSVIKEANGEKEDYIGSLVGFNNKKKYYHV